MLSPIIGLGLAVLCLSVTVLVVISVLRRSSLARREWEAELARLRDGLAAIEAERNLLARQLEEASGNLRDALIQVDRLDRRVRLYEAGSAPASRLSGPGPEVEQPHSGPGGGPSARLRWSERQDEHRPATGAG